MTLVECFIIVSFEFELCRNNSIKPDKNQNKDAEEGKRMGKSIKE